MPSRVAVELRNTFRMMASALLVALLAACTARDPIVSNTLTTPSGDWKIEQQTDRITGAPIRSAYLANRSASHSSEAFRKSVALQISCFKNQPVVRIAFEVKIGSNRNSILGYRFDDKTGHEIEARFLQDYKTVVIEDRKEAEQFIDEMATSQSLYIRIRSLNAGRASAEFRLAGSPAAIDAALAGCRTARTPEPAGAAARRKISRFNAAGGTLME